MDMIKIDNWRDFSSVPPELLSKDGFPRWIGHKDSDEFNDITGFRGGHHVDPRIHGYKFEAVYYYIDAGAWELNVLFHPDGIRYHIPYTGANLSTTDWYILTAEEFKDSQGQYFFKY